MGDEKKVLEPETLVEEQAVKEIKDAVTITKKEDISKEEAIEKKDPKAIEVPQAQDVKNKDSSVVKEKKMKMVKKKKKKGTTSDTTDTIQFEQIIDTKPEEPEPYIVDEPDSLSEDSSKEVVHTNEKLQIAEEIPVTTLDSSIQSLPSDQKEAEGLPTITVTNEKEKEQKRISIEEEVKKPAPKESAPQKVMKPKEEKPEGLEENVQSSNYDQYTIPTECADQNILPLITNECKIADQNEKESKLKDIKGKGNSAKKSTSFNTNQVADNNQVTLLEKESGKEINKKIVEERASQSIDSLREHILVENVTNEESSDEKKFEKVTDENAKEVASKQILKVPDSSSEIVFETVINKEAKKIESACVSPTYTSSQKHITVKDEGVTEETASKPESFAYKPIKCNIKNVEDSAIHQNQILEVDINEKEDNIDPLDTIVDAKVSHEFDNNLVAQKSKIVSLEMESSHIAEANTDEEKTANAIIEACKGAIVVEKSVDGETHKESNLQETSTNKKAIRKDSTCIRKTADKTEVPVMENLSKTPTDYFTVANAKVYSESNPCAQVEDSNIIIDTTGNIKEEEK